MKTYLPVSSIPAAALTGRGTLRGIAVTTAVR